jgi:hypothetical protein
MTEQEKWNVVYKTTIAGTVSQQKIDELREEVKKFPHNMYMIYKIDLKPDSPDEEYAKYLMLNHETIEEENLDMEIEDCEKV